MNEPKRPPRTIRRFLSFLKPHKGALAGLCAVVFAARLAGLPIPLIYKTIIDRALPERDGALLLRLIIIFALLLILVRLLRFVLHVASAWVQQNVLHEVRVALYAHIQNMGLRFFKRHATGGLLSRIVSDVAQVQTVLSQEVFELAAAVVQLAVIGVLLFSLNLHLALYAAGVFPVLFLLAFLFQKKLYRVSRIMQEKRESLSARLQENLSGVQLIQSLGIEKARRGKVADESAALKRTVVRAESIGSSVTLCTFVLTDLPLTVLVWGYGGFLVLDNMLELGSLLAFSHYVKMLYDPVIRIFQFNVRLQTARASIERIYEVLDTEPEMKDRADAVSLRVKEGEIRFERVTLQYEPGVAPAVKAVDLVIEPGEVLGIAGPSGAGKTTLAAALLRFLSPVEGRILIDGRDLETVSRASLCRQVGFVRQHAFLFSDTIESNIALGRPEASRAEVIEAARFAQADGFISGLPRGYDTVVGEGGAGLSAGQRQRIALARVFLQDPPLLVFDEALSSVDAASEAMILDALKRIIRKRTVVMIAHRFSTLKLCRRIAVFAEGRLVETGSHETLQRKGGLYRALLDAQMFDGPPKGGADGGPS